MKKIEIYPQSLKRELSVTGGGAFLFFVILIGIISFVWIQSIIVQTKNQYKHELSITAETLNSMIENTESHVHRMKASFEMILPDTGIPDLIGPAPFDTDTSTLFSLYQYSHVRSDTSTLIAEALSLFDVVYSTHATDSVYQWSYFYDAQQTFSTLYPKLSLNDILEGTNTTTPDSMLTIVFAAGGTHPVKLVAPENNPSGHVIWTNPYTDAAGAGLMVSILAPLFHHGEFVGVVGTDITLEKILSFIKHHHYAVMDVSISDNTGKTIATTVSKTSEESSFLALKFSEELNISGWRAIGTIEAKQLLQVITPKLIMPLAVILAAIITYLILKTVFLRRFVYPSLTLAGFVIEAGRKDVMDIPKTIPNLWNVFFTQVIDGITERKKLSEQLHQSHKMEAVGQLAGGVAHDFNNALAGIMGAVELLKMDSLSEKERQEYLELIITAGNRAGDLTKRLLTFSKKGAKSSSAVNCSKIVADTVELLKHTVNKNITIVVDNRAIQSSIVGETSLLHNALMNLGINASHAMPNGGELTFALENLRLNTEYCESSSFDIKPGEYLEISVRDTGTGMSKEIISRMFEPFFTTKAEGKGTGLGMAAVYGTVREHNGAITVYSELGTGSVFHLYLPVTTETVQREIQMETEISGSGTILLIDDEELVRITAKALLQSMGFQVLLANNGQEGIDIFENSHQNVDIIILDMIMPVLSGKAAFPKLKEIDPQIPIVIASGFTKEEEMEKLNALGVAGFLNKPFRKAELAQVLKILIKEEQ